MRNLPQGLPDDEAAVFRGEVDVNLDPTVGSRWTTRGIQAAAETPGANDQRSAAGTIHWRTGRVVLTRGRPNEGPGGGPVLPPQRRHPRPRGVAGGPGVRGRVGAPGEAPLPTGGRPGHQPARAGVVAAARGGHPQPPVRTMAELLDLTFDWFATRTHFRVRSEVYELPPGQTP